jgi:hypothetical protein
MSESVLPSQNNSASDKQREQQKHQNFKNINEPKEFDIEEAKPSPDNQITTEQGGTIDLGKRLDPLETLERMEKMKIRKHLTYTIVSLSFLWVLIGLFHYLITGNSFLIFAASPMGGPILIIMGYYFGDQLRQKHIYRGP